MYFFRQGHDIPRQQNWLGFRRLKRKPAGWFSNVIMTGLRRTKVRTYGHGRGGRPLHRPKQDQQCSLAA